MHQEELLQSYNTYVIIMVWQMGVGGDDSWGAPVLPQYCISSHKDVQYLYIISQCD